MSFRNSLRTLISFSFRLRLMSRTKIRFQVCWKNSIGFSCIFKSWMRLKSLTMFRLFRIKWEKDQISKSNSNQLKRKSLLKSKRLFLILSLLLPKTCLSLQFTKQSQKKEWQSFWSKRIPLRITWLVLDLLLCSRSSKTNSISFITTVIQLRFLSLNFSSQRTFLSLWFRISRKKNFLRSKLFNWDLLSVTKLFTKL